MKQLPIDLEELAFAFEQVGWESKYYLDTETGQLILLAGDIGRQLEELYEEAYDPESGEEPDLEELLAELDVDEWDKDRLREADLVERGYGSRFIQVPEADSREGYRDMERFLSTVEDGRLRNRLGRAIQGRGAFRRFKDVLLEDPEERERWFAFKGARVEQRVLEWLEFEGIEPVVAAE